MEKTILTASQHLVGTDPVHDLLVFPVDGNRNWNFYSGHKDNWVIWGDMISSQSAQYLDPGSVSLRSFYVTQPSVATAR